MSVKNTPILAEICNISSDIIKNIRFAWIVEQQVSVEEILSQLATEQILKINLLPDDLQINSKQKNSDAGAYFTHSYTITVQPNQVNTHKLLTYFTNTKVLLFLFTTDQTYWVGTNEQGLLFLFDEDTDAFHIHLSGDTYFPALRN